MHNIIKFKWSCLFLLLFCSTSFALEPANLSYFKDGLVHYYESGQYFRDLSRVDERASQYILERVGINRHQKHPEKLAVVFDIDETCLSNYDSMKKLNFGGNSELWDAAAARATCPAISPTFKVYNLARKNGVAIFFITGRKEKLRMATIENLKKAGFTQWTGLYLKPENYSKHSAIPYKSSSRGAITRAGYHIIANIGDQKSDLIGNYSERVFKLPNPYYFLP